MKCLPKSFQLRGLSTPDEPKMQCAVEKHTQGVKSGETLQTHAGQTIPTPVCSIPNHRSKRFGGLFTEASIQQPREGQGDSCEKQRLPWRGLQPSGDVISHMMVTTSQASSPPPSLDHRHRMRPLLPGARPAPHPPHTCSIPFHVCRTSPCPRSFYIHSVIHHAPYCWLAPATTYYIKSASRDPQITHLMTAAVRNYSRISIFCVQMCLGSLLLSPQV